MSRWGRLYGGTYNHRKINLLREQFPSDWRSWYVLIDLAIEVNDDGWIYASPGVPYDPKMLCKIIGIKRANTLQLFLNCLSMLDLIQVNHQGILLLSFAERNYISDCSTPRVQKYREKQKDETFQKQSCNVAETGLKRPRDRDRNRDINILKEPPLPPKGGNGYDDDFLAWWNEYPNRRKSGKPKVYKKWLQLKKAGELPPLPEMLRTLEKQKISQDWIKNNGDYIPGPFPYLNQSKYIDESRPIKTCSQPGIATWLQRQAEKGAIDGADG